SVLGELRKSRARLEAGRAAIGTLINAGHVTATGQAPNDLAAPVGTNIRQKLDLVAAGAQAVDDHGIGLRLDHDPAATDPLPARRIQARLRVHAVVQRVDHQLEVPLRLHEATHQPEGADGPAVVSEEAGDDGVEGALAGRQTVRVTIFE